MILHWEWKRMRQKTQKGEMMWIVFLGHSFQIGIPAGSCDTLRYSCAVDPGKKYICGTDCPCSKFHDAYESIYFTPKKVRNEIYSLRAKALIYAKTSKFQIQEQLNVFKHS